MKYYLSTLVLLCAVLSLSAQSIITTESGKRISVNEDGTWEYISNNPDELSTEESNVSSTKVLMEVDQDQNSVFELPSDAAENNTISTVEQNTGLENFEEELTQLYTAHLIQLTNNQGQKTVLKEEIALLKKGEDEALYTDTEELNTALAHVEAQIKNSSKIVKESSFLLSGIHNTAMNDKEISSYRNRIKLLLNITPYNTPVSELSIADFYFEKQEAVTPDFCQVIFDGYDESIKRDRKETASRFFFSYTHPKLKAHFKDKDFLNCNASLAKLDNKTFLQLNLKIASKDARKNYGQIEKGAMLRILLIDGTILYSTNMISVSGDIEKYTGNTKYDPIYHLSKDDLKKLKNTEIDKVGVLWTTGYEEYDIYEVDFLINQLSCLDK